MMTKSYLERAKESIVQDQLFENSFLEFAKIQYDKLIEDTIKEFVITNKNKFGGLCPEEIIDFNMTEFYQYVIETQENDNNKTNELNALMNKTLDKMTEKYGDDKKNKYEYVYVVQNYNGMITVVGRSSFYKSLDNKYSGNNDLFQNIAYFKYDKEKDNHEDKINLSIFNLDDQKKNITGTQSIETIKHCIKKTGNQRDKEVLDDYFKKNKEEIRHKLRRLYKKAWIIPMKSSANDAELFESALGDYLEEQKFIFISNKDSHKN